MKNDRYAAIRQVISERANSPDYATWYNEFARNDILDLLDACAFYRAYPEYGVEAKEEADAEIEHLRKALEWIGNIDNMSGANQTQRGLIIEAAMRAREALQPAEDES